MSQMSNYEKMFFDAGRPVSKGAPVEQQQKKTATFIRPPSSKNVNVDLGQSIGQHPRDAQMVNFGPDESSKNIPIRKPPSGRPDSIRVKQ